MKNLLLGKIMTVDRAAAWRAELRKNGRKLALTNGCFDLLSSSPGVIASSVILSHLSCLWIFVSIWHRKSKNQSEKARKRLRFPQNGDTVPP